MIRIPVRQPWAGFLLCFTQISNFLFHLWNWKANIGALTSVCFSSLGSVLTFPVCQITFSVSIRVQKIFENSICNNISDIKNAHFERYWTYFWIVKQYMFILKLSLLQWSYMAANELNKWTDSFSYADLSWKAFDQKFGNSLYIN